MTREHHRLGEHVLGGIERIDHDQNRAELLHAALPAAQNPQ
jgi:hypothetical protein